MGYHLSDIPKGVAGEISKIKEELSELEDAMNQKNRIMALVELSDLFGAISLYVEKHFPGFDMQDLYLMAETTKSAFIDGSRK
jgi:hypothetical protein